VRPFRQSNSPGASANKYPPSAPSESETYGACLPQASEISCCQPTSRRRWGPHRPGKRSNLDVLQLETKLGDSRPDHVMHLLCSRIDHDVSFGRRDEV